jgi:multidrug resistance efflux pump
VTAKLLRDTGIVIGAAIIALALAASTLRRRSGALKRSTSRALRVIPLVVLIVTGVLVGNYFLEAHRYVSTDNAQIDGDKIPVTAPVGGTLVGWHAAQGSTLRRDQTIGRIQIGNGFAQSQRVIRAPGDGTVVLDNGVEGTFVTPGAQLAVAYDLSEIFVTARVDETAIGDVRLGRQVDIAVDAYPDITLTGYVWGVQGGTAGLFSQFPQADTTAYFQKVTQWIPVKIAITDRKNLTLVPGMNVTVKIHKN